MEIKIEDYLNKEEIKELCIEEMRDKIKQDLRYTDASVLLSNTSYDVIFGMVSEVIGMKEEDIKQLITDKVVNIINELSSYSVFKCKEDIYTKHDSLAQTYLNEAVTNNRELIENRVKELMISFEESKLSDEITDIVYEIVDKRLFAKE